MPEESHPVNREEEGKTIARSVGSVVCESAGKFYVRSGDARTLAHTVLVGAGYYCDCADYRYRDGLCKHIFAVVFWLGHHRMISPQAFPGLPTTGAGERE